MFTVGYWVDIVILVLCTFTCKDSVLSTQYSQRARTRSKRTVPVRDPSPAVLPVQENPPGETVTVFGLTHASLLISLRLRLKTTTITLLAQAARVMALIYVGRWVWFM